MAIEIEVKFLDVDFKALRKRLKAAGAECTCPMRLMRRVIIETPELKKSNAFIRVRDEGNKVTLTFKQFESLAVDGAKEHEVTVNSFEEAIAIFNAAGLHYRSYQESKRETWRLHDVEVVLDEWPWLSPYIEIEGASESQIRKVANMLGFDWQDAVFGDVMAAYRKQYPHLTMEDTVGNVPEVRFDNPLPDFLKT